MCGIGGIYLKKNNSFDLNKCLEKVCLSQNHRGPDFSSTWLSECRRVGFSHNRLSILDLSVEGNQPFISRDQKYVIVFNGEIYNYLELKDELSIKGEVFKSNSDTEILLIGYKVWGENVLNKIRGMFSFAIFDIRKDIVFCARDKVGKKPFVYSETNYGVIFASEISALKNFPEIDLSVDKNSLATMLLHNLRHIPDPFTAYKNIKRLKAGHAMIIKKGEIKSHWRYWEPKKTNIETTKSSLRETLEESINLRLRSDIPVGALLSGGIDSSSIVSIMSRLNKNRINTYSLGFDEEDEDIIRARFMSKQLNTNHKEFFFDEEIQWEAFNYLIKIYGDPIMLLPLVHSYILCKAIKSDGISVVMVGNGADEIFYGYSGHLRTLKMSKILNYTTPFLSSLSFLNKYFWLCDENKNIKANFYKSQEKRYWKNFINKKEIKKINNVVSKEMKYWGNLSPSNEFLDISNFIGLMIENTHSVTIASDLPAMAASVEMRAPFLDQEIIEMALNTNYSLKIPNPQNPDWMKAILRESVRDLLPNSILSAKKRGFGSGIQEDIIFRGSWKNKIENLMNDINDGDGLLCKENIYSYWKDFLNENPRTKASMIGKIVSIQIWLNQNNI